ncbi:MAG TPA: PKD domain-containing protein, partial [Ferruginibacter sp.]|nr:PKD domain-containing protein [Ferruginibacter sp.]
MKKIFTLLWLTICAFAFKAAAQGTTCNAEYGYQYLNYNTVKFNPQETQGPPLVTHAWNFGDGSAVSNLVSPTHTFAAAGNYAVVHTIIRYNQNNQPVCTQSFTKVVNITLCDLVVDFSWNTVAANPLTIAFQNLSVPLSNTDSITWQFGDNTSSHEVNPVHTYATAGTYNVCLIVKKFPAPTNGQCIKYICKTVVVTTPCTLIADFNWTVSTANPLMFYFNNLSVPLSNTDSISWTFGDGSSANTVNAVHTYSNPGTYNVCLRVKKLTPPGTPPCVREICKTVVIPPPCNLVVDFNWTVSANNPLTLEFHNLSGPIAVNDSIRWTFGDGTSSNQFNPVHTYTAPGTYTVCLRIIRFNGTNYPCVREICKTVVIPVPCTLVVNFTSEPVLNEPLNIKFTNTSSPTSSSDSLRWTFGDGTSLSGLQSDPNIAAPVHHYANAGSFTVCLRVKKNNLSTPNSCVREFCRTVVVNPPCNIVPDFTWTATTANPLTIEFHNTSTNTVVTDSIRWTFGDGSSSNQYNAVHTYAVAGTYTVCMRIIRFYPNSTTPPCIREICKTVVVTNPCTLVVGFNAEPLPANPLSIRFINQSAPVIATDSMFWSFGDGTTLTGVVGNPAVANPIHTYANAGSYNVCLTVKKHPTTTNAPCIRTWCRSVVVPEPCNLVVGFSSEPLPTNPLSIRFTNTSAPVIATDSLFWTFGDGTSLAGVQGNPAVATPIHTYTAPGSYNVCLTVKKHPTTTNAPCIRTWCKAVIIPVPCNLVASFTSQPDPNHPLRIKFTNTSTPSSPTDSVRWTFGDGSSVSGLQSDPNIAAPTHNYATAGNYTVCIRVKKNYSNTPPGAICVRELCRTVVVEHPCNFYVNFSWRLDSLNLRKVFFTNLSTPPTAAATAVWTFGDGTSVTSWNAVHEYAQPGAYRVCLRVYLGNNTNCVREICDTVYIPHPVPPCTQLSRYHFERFPNDNQRYKFIPDYINQNLQYTWTFGDGTGSHDPIATHRYAQPGIYVACLTVWRGQDCASTTCHEIRVEAQ